LGVNRVVVDTHWYCRVLCGTAGYSWLLFGIGWYWGALKYTRGTVEYCGVLQGTAGHCLTLLGSARYCMVLLGTRGVLGAYWGKEGYWGYFGILQGTMGTGATWGR